VLLVYLIYWIAFASYYRIKVVYVQPQKSTSGYLNNISAEEMALYSTLIEEALEHEQLYLDATLTVNKMAQKLMINPKTVSAVINGHLNKSFNELVYDYRLEEVKKRLLNPKYAHLTISGITLESGFNSQATFQRVFNNRMGMSPREYLASQLKKTT
jgi:AraC-like DNA-binding protein